MREQEWATPVRPKRHLVNLLTDSTGSARTSVASAAQENASAKLNLVASGGAESVSAPSYPSTNTNSSMTVDPTLFVDRRPNQGVGCRARRGVPSFICHECYQKGHLRPNCPRTVRDLAILAFHYSRLTEEEKKNVPDTAYLRAIALLNFQVNGSVLQPTVNTGNKPHRAGNQGAPPGMESKTNSALRCSKQRGNTTHWQQLSEDHHSQEAML